MSAPMSQSDSFAFWPSVNCLTMIPNASDRCSLSTPGLTVIAEGRGVLRDAVRQLMGNHIEGCSEAREDSSVGVAVNHLPTVPESAFSNCVP